MKHCRKLHISRDPASGDARSFRCSSSPHMTRCAGLMRGPRAAAAFLLAFLFLLSPALAAETPAAPAGVWYEPYVEVCDKAGLLDAEHFDPQAVLTDEEGAELLFRLREALGGTEDIPELNSWNEGCATRLYFCWALSQVAGELSVLNEIDGLPDCSDEKVMSLCRAGVLTGVDRYGTFVPETSINHAEAAALCARVLRPELRVSFTPVPLPETGYTLTYLSDGEPNTGWPGAALCDVNGEYFITLEGKRVDWPKEGHVPSFALEQYVDCLMIGTYLNSVRDLKMGILDRDGNYVVPLRTYDWATPTGDGHFVVNQGEEDYFLLNSDGTLETVLPELTYPDGTWQDFNQGLCPKHDPEIGLWGYVDLTGNWALEPQWNYAYSFMDGYAVVSDAEHNHGVIDRNGSLVIPMIYRQLALYRVSPGYTGGGYFLYTDRQGRNGWLSPDGTAHPGAPGNHSSSNVTFANGYAVVHHNDFDSAYYLGPDLRPASQKFDWAGPINAEGKGFVGLNGKIYRIEFTREAK